MESVDLLFVPIVILRHGIHRVVDPLKTIGVLEAQMVTPPLPTEDSSILNPRQLIWHIQLSIALTGFANVA
jgi:hypothetical protein